MDRELDASSHEAARDVIVVGGGAAGWLCALGLRSKLDDTWSVTVLSAPAIPIIGVGESSTGLMTSFLRSVGIQEREFISRARATMKLGTYHCNWLRSGHSYFGPIDNPGRYADHGGDQYDVSKQFAAMADEVSVADAHLHGWLMRLGRVPISEDQGIIERIPSNAWHFDAFAAAEFFADVAKARGVRHVLGQVREVRRNADGSVVALELTDASLLSAELYVDASGMKRVLSEPSAFDWIAYEELALDSAVAGVVDYSAPEVPTFTRATAASCGWIWQIPTLDRIGVGYVYSSRFLDEDAARGQLSQFFGGLKIDGPSPRFSPGRLRASWLGNVVAVGLAAGFPEPLESTSLHVTILQILSIVEQLSQLEPSADIHESLRNTHNARVAAFQDDYRDFIALHYLGRGLDTPFWHDARARALQAQLPAQSLEWRHRPPTQHELKGPNGCLSGNLILPIADGLGLTNRRHFAGEVSAEAIWSGREMRRLHESFANTAMLHRDALIRLSQATH